MAARERLQEAIMLPLCQRPGSNRAVLSAPRSGGAQVVFSPRSGSSCIEGLTALQPAKQQRSQSSSPVARAGYVSSETLPDASSDSAIPSSSLPNSRKLDRPGTTKRYRASRPQHIQRPAWTKLSWPRCMSGCFYVSATPDCSPTVRAGKPLSPRAHRKSIQKTQPREESGVQCSCF
jgi:hypothetical protein